jgi:hypothetical protein
MPTGRITVKSGRKLALAAIPGGMKKGAAVAEPGSSRPPLCQNTTIL